MRGALGEVILVSFCFLWRLCLPSLQMALYILSMLVSVQCCAVYDARWVSAPDSWSSSAQGLAVDCMHSSICSDMLALYPLVLAGVTQLASVPGVGAWVTLSRVFALHALLPGYLTLCCVRSCSLSEVLFEWYSLGGVPCACRLCLFLLVFFEPAGDSLLEVTLAFGFGGAPLVGALCCYHTR